MANHSRRPPQRRFDGPKKTPGDANKTPADSDYDALLVLERLESLLEEMEELGVSSRAEIEARIEALNRQLDAEEK